MRSGFAFSAFLDAKQLMVPEVLEFTRPLVQGLDGLRVHLIEHLAAVTSHPNETDLAEYAKVLETEGCSRPRVATMSPTGRSCGAR